MMTIASDSRFSPRASVRVAAGLAGLAVGFAASASAADFTDDFSTNTLSSYTNPSGGRTAFTYNSTNGYLNLPNNNTTYAATRSATIGNFTDFPSVTVSADFLTNTALSDTGGINLAAVGLSTTAAGFYGTFTGLEVTVRATGTSAFLRLRDGAGGSLHDGGTLTLATNTWYTLSLTLTETGTPNSFLASSSLIRVSDQAVISSFAPQSISLTLAESADLFAGLAGTRNTNRGAVAMDNFTVSAIPEPSSAAALVGLMALGAVATRRRSRR